MRPNDSPMIEMELVKVEPLMFYEVELPAGELPIRIEVRASAVIDCGIMNDENYRRFADSDTDIGIPKAVWYEERRSVGFTFDLGRYPDHWLILFNAYSDDPLFVAYAILGE